MGYGHWLDYTDEKIVCQAKCEHTDCKGLRERAVCKCTICGKPFEAGQAYYRNGDSWTEFNHVVCVMEQDKQSAKEMALVAE